MDILLTNMLHRVYLMGFIAVTSSVHIRHISTSQHDVFVYVNKINVG